MKKMLTLLLTAMLLFAFAACGAKAPEKPEQKTESEPTKNPNVVVGRDEFYPFENTQNIELTDEQKAIFQAALGGVVGVGYRPFGCLGIQTMRDQTIYCFLAMTAGVYPDATWHPMLLYISVDAEGHAELVNGADMPIVPYEGCTRPMTVTEAVTGGWTYAEDPAITDEMALLFYEALADKAGATYEPLVNVGTQVVAGMNRCILARITPDDPDLAPRYAFVYVWEKLDGTAELYEIADYFMIGDLCEYGM
ncbi:MAG: hypothetical protein IJJ86_07330 [Clostridia bacterium]|nr:hypothetical protein [Clostridia bacterium]